MLRTEPPPAQKGQELLSRVQPSISRPTNTQPVFKASSGLQQLAAETEQLNGNRLRSPAWGASDCGDPDSALGLCWSLYYLPNWQLTWAIFSNTHIYLLLHFCTARLAAGKNLPWCLFHKKILPKYTMWQEDSSRGTPIKPLNCVKTKTKPELLLPTS